MAKAENMPAEEEKTEHPLTTEPSKNKSNLMIILIIALVLLVIAGGVLGWLIVTSHQTPMAEEESMTDSAAAMMDLMERSEERRKNEGPPLYVPLGRIVTNVTDSPTRDKDKLVTEFQLKVDGPKNEELVKARIPEIKQIVINQIKIRSYEELSSPEGIDELRKDILIGVNRVIDPGMAMVLDNFQKKRVGRDRIVTGHDVETDTSGRHETGLATSERVRPSDRQLEEIIKILPVQQVIYTEYIFAP